MRNKSLGQEKLALKIETKIRKIILTMQMLLFASSYQSVTPHENFKNISNSAVGRKDRNQKKGKKGDRFIFRNYPNAKVNKEAGIIMPRMGRVVLPHYPHHIVQRGHNRQATFAEQSDYERYLATLREFKEEYDVAVYAFCLMTNHVHLLLAPREPTGIGKLMKRLAGRQTRHHNRLEGRSGTLWESRYKSSSCSERGLSPGLLPLHRT